MAVDASFEHVRVRHSLPYSVRDLLSLPPLQSLLEDPTSTTDLTPVSTETYASLDYWRFRFTQESSKEWLANYADLCVFLAAAVPRTARILLVGNGNSSLPMDMADDGYENITATDYADTAVTVMSERTAATHPRIRWRVADMLDLADFEDASFDVVFDKAAMDAVLAGRGDTWDPPEDLLLSTAAVARAACRVLVPGGLYLQLSFAQKHFRKAYLCQEGIPWALQHVQSIPVGLGYFLYSLRRDGTAPPELPLPPAASTAPPAS